MLVVIIILYVIGISLIVLSIFGSKTEGLTTRHTLYTFGSAIIVIAIFMSIGYVIQYLTSVLYSM
ncbi:hypothetical protein [Staphylococcus simiae]|uniref:Uncharacterized protein n=1 Tax=Staphylococcus simiae CCM 7213 = CCUG 51256 TaxID=911238 RepID=G5JLE7_9STAP|nr:hypothetical protein [Staphylococcus simiae]EHJ06988.1 hypothetical protein SS7213T_11565 [Staphylococcus simiae CCM 7213 = CCUG 51256]PNZ10959.1 hypothetical protein CD113_09260 [Staphylococcus simiae]SNV60758.1 membrane protein [Staphylococcus simiae]